MQVVSSYFTFPEIRWWLQVANAAAVTFDIHEHHQKMSGRNRYLIGGSNNAVLLSIPLVNGRNQHVPVTDVKIKNETKWQVQHWRTLVSVYNRSPFFFHYEPTLSSLFEKPFTNLIDFNMAAMEWAKQQLKLDYEELRTGMFVKEYDEECLDLRNEKYSPIKVPHYQQVFEDRIGFVENISILDLLFSEGPAAGRWLKANCSVM